ncbi:MAG: cobalt ABC transporter ATP-binding protein [Lentisphaerae bacterium RIFOXYC12_FULL_60_16]|nr:MAG: cobalt ABC transporter ATP-binding protein [Lentisphaerae bacterium RIFOXYC12_FULL_60_16]OGV85424.1 MAG: cobalt ABC transporter ATP-binding protein [Lentisphaerae bacterium RIFOXYB12_FULL_60_10]
MSHHIVEVRDLRFAYPDGTEALKGISFRISHGGAVAIVGGNGAGKSTLLQHLNGCLTATSGTVIIGDTPLTPGTIPRARRCVGMVFQDPDDQLFMPTVAGDVAFGPLNAGLPPDMVEQRTASALERVGMTHVRERPPYRLSAGEKRAVAIATVLAMTPDILVMDEPSSNLDPRARRRLIELLLSFEHTRIIATHDLELVLEVCTRVILLDAGIVVADGPARDILGNEPLLLAHGLECPYSLRPARPR